MFLRFECQESLFLAFVSWMHRFEQMALADVQAHKPLQRERGKNMSTGILRLLFKYGFKRGQRGTSCMNLTKLVVAEGV